MTSFAVLRLFGLRATGTTISWKFTRFLPSLSVLLLPVPVAVIHQVAFATQTPNARSYYMWIFFYTAVDFCVVLLQWMGCRAFLAMTGSLDRMLTDAGRTAVRGWIDRGTALSRQYAYMAVGSVAALVVLFALTRAERVTQHLYVDLASYLTVAITGAAAANSVYWILRAVRLARIVTNVRHIKLLWFAPAKTVGIERIARWYRFVALLAAAGVTLAFVPVIQVSRMSPGNTLLTVTKWTLAGVFMATITLFALYSQWRLSAAVEQVRAKVIERIEQALPARAPARAAEVSDEDARINDLLSYVLASPTTVVNGQTLASTLLAMVTGAIPFVVTLLAR
ncbi:hypothetical protein [Streptomyces sp. NPDC057287]|uniref:hypothetical protein n=1 Tax=Streptomyces sp. NPDC057287 TaxID=3346086 RepID=UPI0036321653